MEAMHQTKPDCVSKSAVNTTIQDLPTEILQHIFSYFSQKELLNTMCKVSLYWYQIGVSVPVWKEIIYNSDNKTVFDDIHVLLKRLTISNEAMHNILMSSRKDILPNLTAIHISTKLKWTDAFGEFLLNCENLQEVKYFPDKKIDMELSLQVLSKLSLTTLNIHYWDSDIDALADRLRAFALSQSRLRSLSVMAREEDDGKKMKDIINCCTTLRCFKIYNELLQGSPFDTSSDPLYLTEVVINVRLFNDQNVRCVAERCHLLKVLNIERCLEITGKTLQYLECNCPLLEEIYLGDSFTFEGQGITGSTFASFVRSCFRLRKVSFKKCSFFNDSDVRTLVTTCLHLKMIRLQQCLALTDSAIHSVATNCRNIEIADFRKNKSLTFESVVELIQSCAKLRVLDLYDCPSIVLPSKEHSENQRSGKWRQLFPDDRNNRENSKLEIDVYNYSLKNLT